VPPNAVIPPTVATGTVPPCAANDMPTKVTPVSNLRYSTKYARRGLCTTDRF